MAGLNAKSDVIENVENSTTSFRAIIDHQIRAIIDDQIFEPSERPPHSVSLRFRLGI